MWRDEHLWGPPIQTNINNIIIMAIIVMIVIIINVKKYFYLNV